MIIRVPDIYAEAVSGLTGFGYHFRLSKTVSPWDRTFEEVSGSGAVTADAVSYQFEMGDSQWKVEVSPPGGWYSKTDLALLFGAGLIVVLLLAGLQHVLMERSDYREKIKNNEKLEKEKGSEAQVDNLRVLSGKRVLLAEDNELNAEITMAILEDLGMQAERAEDGLVCVTMLRNAEAGYYDLVIMDIQMPNMNGYEAARRIREMPDAAKAKIPIVALTANTFEADKQKSFEAGMNGHLAKPVDISELTETLASFFRA